MPTSHDANANAMANSPANTSGSALQFGRVVHTAQFSKVPRSPRALQCNVLLRSADMTWCLPCSCDVHTRKSKHTLGPLERSEGLQEYWRRHMMACMLQRSGSTACLGGPLKVRAPPPRYQTLPPNPNPKMTPPTYQNPHDVACNVTADASAVTI